MTAKEVRKLRDKLQASQALMARYLNVSTKLVQAWEADQRSPTGPALVLLRIMERQPGLVDTLHAQTNGDIVSTPSPRRRKNQGTVRAR
jgi:transcriptional regulator with XRE-family HTH domain